MVRYCKCQINDYCQKYLELLVYLVMQTSTVPTFKRMKEVMSQNPEESLLETVGEGVAKVTRPIFSVNISTCF